MENPFRPKKPKNPFRSGNPFRAGTPDLPTNTPLPPDQEGKFNAWLINNQVTDLDQPDSHYDYRGAFLAGQNRDQASQHFDDQFKLPGHESYGVTPQERSHAAVQFQGSSQDEQPTGDEHPLTVGEHLRHVNDWVGQQNSHLADFAHPGREALGALKQAAAGTAEIGLGLAKTWPAAGATVWGGKEAGQAASAPFDRAAHRVADWAGPPTTTVGGLARVVGPFLPGQAYGAIRAAQIGKDAAAILPRIESANNYMNKVDDLHATMARNQEEQLAMESLGRQQARMRLAGLEDQGLAAERSQAAVDAEGQAWQRAGHAELTGLVGKLKTQREAEANAASAVANNPSEAGMLGRQFDEKLAAARAQPSVPPVPETQAQFPEVAGALERRYPNPFRNPFRTQQGGAKPEVLAALAGGAAGAAHGYATADPEDSKVTRAVTQGLLGAAAGYGIAKGGEILGSRSTASVLPPPVQAAYDVAQEGIDWGGKIQRAIDKGDAGGFLARLQAIGDAVANGKAPLERVGRQAEGFGLRPTENPRYVMSYVKSEDQTIHMAMTEGVPDPITRTPIGIGYKQITEPFGNDEEKIKQGFTYVMAERGVARGPTAYGNNLAEYQAHVDLVNHFRGDQQMLDFRDRVENFVDGIGNYAVRSGLWTPEQWAAMKASDAPYIPWKRVMSDLLRQTHPSAGGTGLANVTSGVKGFVGSARVKADPALAFAEYAQAIIRRADRYRVGSSLFEAADRMGAAGDILLSRIQPPGAPNLQPLRQAAINRALANANAQGIHLNQTTVETLDDLFTPVFDAKNPTIWRNGANGQREYAVVNSPQLWKAVQKLNQLDDDGLRKFLDLTIRPLKRIFVATTTGLTPRFAGGTNPLRDAIDAMAKSQAGLRPDDIAVGYASAIGGKLGVTKLAQNVARRFPMQLPTPQPGLYETSQRFGLGSVSNFSYPTSPGAYQRLLAPTSKLDRVRASLRAAGSLPLRPFEGFGEISDLGPRLGEMRAAQRDKGYMVRGGQYGPAGAPWTQEDLNLYSTTLGRDVTLDFQNKPGNSVLRLLADYVPFFGPSTQSPVQMLYAAHRNPQRMAAVVTAVSSAATMAWVMKHRSAMALEKTNDRNPGERAAFLLFPLDDEAKVTVRATMGQEMGLVAAGVTAGLDAWVDQDPHAANVFIQAVNRAMPPIGVPVLNALVENMRNKRSFGDTPVEPHRLLEEKPEDRRLPTTSPTFDIMARAARAVPGLGNTSPLQAENVFRSVFSNVTPGITEVTDPIAERLGGVSADRKMPVPWSQNPLNPLGTFVANPTPRTTASEQDYYRFREGINQAHTSANIAAAGDSDEDFDRIVQKYDNELRPEARAILRSADRDLKHIREDEIRIQSDYRAGKLTGEEARQALDQTQQDRQEAYRTAAPLLREATAK